MTTVKVSTARSRTNYELVFRLQPKTDGYFLSLVHVAGIQWMFMLSVTWDKMSMYIINMIHIELEVIFE